MCQHVSQTWIWILPTANVILQKRTEIYDNKNGTFIVTTTFVYTLCGVPHILEGSGWGLPSQFPPFRYFPKLSALSKHKLTIKYDVHFQQVSPQLTCGDTCQIWTWFKVCDVLLWQIEFFRNREINVRSFSNPHPWSFVSKNIIYKNLKVCLLYFMDVDIQAWHFNSIFFFILTITFIWCCVCLNNWRYRYQV